MPEQKKPYTPPTLTEHGDVVEQTRGTGGKYWEILLPKVISDFEVERDGED
jgi:hypothetical protein